MDYNNFLSKQFKNKIINVVRHDTSPTGYPLFIELHLEKTIKDKGDVVRDASNYIFRKFGLSFQHPPEYVGKGKKTTLRFYQDWNQAENVVESIKKYFGVERIKSKQWLPIEFKSVTLQNKL